MFEDSTHGGRQRNRAGCVGTHHFNSRPHGGRPSTCRHWLSGLLFQLTPSRRATPLVIFFAHQAIFQLTPSRRVTLKLSKGGRLTIISTHALTEGDADIFCRFLRQKISTHALTEGDTPTVPVSDHPFVFQLTPSRRATWTKYRLFQLHPFQLTPSRRATAFRSHQKP